MATTNVSSPSFPAQPPVARPASYRRALHLAIIQQPVRRWERPWRHQRAIVLFANSPAEVRTRIQQEGRIKPGEQVLLITAVGK